MSTRPMTVTTAISPAYGQLRCDRDMQELLRVHGSLRPAVLDKRTDPAAARTALGLADAVRIHREGHASAPGDEAASRITHSDFTLRTAACSLTARVYKPAGNGPHPVVLYFHGGGWVTGSIDSDDASARGIAARANAAVVAVNYRLAPEHRFPAAWEDALAAYQWLLDGAASLGGDGTRIALAGEGAGGHLALATALAARDEGLRAPRHVLAISPVTQTGTNTESYLENAVAQPLSRAMMVWYFDRLVTFREELGDPRLQLVDADLAGMPSVTLITARIDPLRSDAGKLREALVRAHVPVEWRDYEGVTHGFFGAAEVVRKAREAQAYAGERLAEALAQPAPALRRRHGLADFTGALRRLLPDLSAAPPQPARAPLRG